MPSGHRRGRKLRNQIRKHLIRALRSHYRRLRTSYRQIRIGNPSRLSGNGRSSDSRKTAPKPICSEKSGTSARISAKSAPLRYPNRNRNAFRTGLENDGIRTSGTSRKISRSYAPWNATTRTISETHETICSSSVKFSLKWSLSAPRTTFASSRNKRTRYEPKKAYLRRI